MKQTFIIAEAGVNHNGSLEVAKKLVVEAAKAGADAVKFQTFKAEKLVTADAPKAEYQKRNVGTTGNQLDMLKKLELKNSDFKELANYCKDQGIEFMSTPFDEESADFLDQLGVRQFKIPSGELTNYPLLAHIAKKKKPIILSTGMSSLEEVQEALDVITNSGNRKIIVLQCLSSYPAPINQVNLLAMVTMKKEFGFPVGFSDHTEGIEVAIASVALGAEVIEKHFTLDKNMEGPDHRASLEPDELREMVKSIRNVDLALGDGIKRIAPAEHDVKKVARKSIVALEIIEAGVLLTKDLITIKRPGTGISARDLNKVIGKKTVATIGKNELISWKSIE